MKNKDIMGFKWKYLMTCLCLLSCCTKFCFTSSILPPTVLSNSSNANNTNYFDRSNSSIEFDHANQKQNGTAQISLVSNESTTADVLPNRPNVSDLSVKNNKTNASSDSSVNGIPRMNLLYEDEELSTLTNLTSFGNLTTLNLYNSTHYKIWKHLMYIPNYVICQFYQGGDFIQQDPEVKTYFGGHKVLAMFLGMAGVLACLLILIYCIYIRQHKEEMFSHHRLYGEGFEDPVLHLDTPVDHLDFFSFRDTEFTSAPTPQHKCHKTEAYEAKGDYRVEAPKDTSSNEYLHQIIQMGSIKFS